MSDSDNLYSRILRELYSPAWLRKSGRESYVALAKKLGIDDQTVRSAIARMQKSGFLKTWSINLNPHLFGMDCQSVILKAAGASPKDKVIFELGLVEGIVAIFSFLDEPGFRVVLYSEDEEELERRIRLVSSICGVNEPSVSWKIPFPPCKIGMKKTDWQIVRFLLKDSRKNVSEIAEGIGVSTRTVRRRLEVMSEHGSFFINPIVDVKKIDGFLYHFLISYEGTKDKRAADEMLRGLIRGIVFVDTNAELYTVVGAICQNLSGAREISDRLRTLKGVREVATRVFEDIIPVHAWLDHEIERRLKA